MSIAKRALALLGEEITCRSRVGRGSTFGFCLPLGAGSSAAAQQAVSGVPHEHPVQAEFVRGRNFVIVENDALVAEAMCQSLVMMGGSVECYPNAEDALSHVRVEQADYYIVDYMLGGTLNGVQLLDQLRKKRGTPIHAVLVTGDTSPAFVRGVTDSTWPVLHKPANMTRLLDCLNRVVGLPEYRQRQPAA